MLSECELEIVIIMIVEKAHFSDVFSRITIIKPEGSARGVVPIFPSDRMWDVCHQFTPWNPHPPHLHVCQ